MKRTIVSLLLIAMLTLLATSCGPSSEEIATMTASAWTLTPTLTFTPEPTNTPSPTPTSTPTSTPTPIPFDANVMIVDEEDNPVSGAIIDIAGAFQTTDENGLASFRDLPGETVTLSISAPGYFPSEVTETIDRGPNELSATLGLDPNGLLVINACAPGEKLLYVDDFQDGSAQEWDVFDNNLPGWSLEGDPGNPDDLVIAAREGANMAWLDQETYTFNNSVWRLKFKHVGSGGGHVNFRWYDMPDLSIRYLLSLDNDMHLAKWIPSNHLDVGFVGNMGWDEWHLLEYSFYEGTVSVYIDGKETVTWMDPDPWEGGTINFEPYPEGDSVFYYDDLSVCELSAPFEPIPRPKTGLNLTISVADVEGNPIPNAKINIPELGELDEATQNTDSSGSASWIDLPGANITLKVDAPGYFILDDSLVIEKGENSVNFTLERDEFGKLPSEVCRADEDLAYVQDIQSGTMAGWSQVMMKIEMNVPGVAIIPEPENEGNLILHMWGLSDNAHSDTAAYQDQSFGDSVLRFEAKNFGHMHHHVRWHITEDWNNAYYAFIYGGTDAGGRLDRMIDDNFVTVFQWNKNINDGNWHTYELVSYQGDNQLWIDGRMMGSWTDPDPISEGFFAIEQDFWKADSYTYYDNFAVCNLNAPFVSIFAEEE